MTSKINNKNYLAFAMTIVEREFKKKLNLN